jgi:hypothetical protein
MVMERDMEQNSQLTDLLESLAPRLHTPKAALVAEIEARLTDCLGVEVREAFRAVAEQQHHTAPALNLDRMHKSALVLIAHVLAEMASRRDKITPPQKSSVGDLPGSVTGEVRESI